MTIEEAAKKFGVTTRTIYRWLQNGELEGEKIGGKWFISDDTDLENSDINLENIDDKRGKNDIISKDKLIEQLQTENEYLRKELSQTNQALSEANQQYDESQQRHDEAQQQSNMIIMQLTRQLENQNRMLEDMRNRSLWTRVKAAFSFAS